MPDRDSQHPILQFTDEDARKIKDMLADYEKSKFLGHVVWKLLIIIGATVASVAAFKEHVLALLQRP